MSSAAPDPRQSRRSTTTDPTRKVTHKPGREQGEQRDGAPGGGRGGSLLVAARRFLHRAVFDNAPIKLVALVLSITVFILVNTEKDAVIGVNVRVSYTMPEDRVLVSAPVDQVRITVTGSWRRIKRFDEREIERIHVDLTNMRSGDFAFQEDMVRLPAGIDLLSINPATMRLQFEKQVSKSVPVSVKTVGGPVRGYRVERLAANPSHVTVRGAESVVAAISEVHTLRVSLANHHDSFRETVALVAPEQYADIDDQPQVEVSITMVEELDKRSAGPLPVAIRAAVGGAPVEGLVTEPADVTIVLHGSPDAIERALAVGLEPYVKVLPADINSNRAVEVLVDIKDVGPEIKPREVRVRKP